MEPSAADWHEVTLYRPFVDMTKADIVSLGAKLGVPFEKTWSCYKGQDYIVDAAVPVWSVAKHFI